MEDRQLIPRSSNKNISSLGIDQLQCILTYLPITDAAALACTSKNMNELLILYWDHQCQKYSYKETLQTFFNHQVILAEEKKLLEIFQNGDYSSHWLCRYGSTLGLTHRKLVADVDSFPHRGNEEYIPIVYDKILKRNITVLRDVCWLFMEHTFKCVLPNVYIVLLRIRLEKLRWPSDVDPTHILVKWSDSDGATNELMVTVTAHEWRKLGNDKMKNMFIEGCSTVDHDMSRGWFSLKFGPITVKNECDVYFAFKDIINTWWKRGMSWDYVEIRPV